MARGAARLVLGGALVTGVVIGALAALPWVAAGVVASLLAALVLRVREVETGRTATVGPLPFLVAGMAATVARLVVTFGPRGGAVALVVVVILVLVVAGGLI